MSQKIKSLFNRVQYAPRTGRRHRRDRIEVFYGGESIIRLL